MKRLIRRQCNPDIFKRVFTCLLKIFFPFNKYSHSENMHIPLTSRNEAWNSSINVIYYIQSVLYLYYTALRNISSHISRNANLNAISKLLQLIHSKANSFLYWNLNNILSPLIIWILWTRRNFIIFSRMTLIYALDNWKQCTKSKCHLIEIYCVGWPFLEEKNKRPAI